MHFQIMQPFLSGILTIILAFVWPFAICANQLWHLIITNGHIGLAAATQTGMACFFSYDNLISIISLTQTAWPVPAAASRYTRRQHSMESLNAAAFEELVENDASPCLVLFSRKTCAVCRAATRSWRRSRAIMRTAVSVLRRGRRRRTGVIRALQAQRCTTGFIF
jgi:hypothetical protein